MCHRADKLARRIARQLGIRVQGDDVLYAGQHLGRADDQRKTRLSAAAQQRVQFRQLPALALVTHPHPLLGIPAARAVKQEKSIAFDAAFGIPVLFIQLLDPVARQQQQRLVLRQRFVLRVAKIGQQAKLQALIPVRQEPDFKRLDQMLDVLRACEHGRNHNQRAAVRRNAPGKVQARQLPGRRQQGRHPIDERNCQMTGAQNQEDRYQREYPTVQAAGLRFCQQAPGKGQRQ